MAVQAGRFARLVGSAALIALATAGPALADPWALEPPAPDLSAEDVAIPLPAVPEGVALGEAGPTIAARPLDPKDLRTAIDIAIVREALNHYRRGDIAQGDLARARISDRAARSLLEWVGIRSGAALGFDRVAAFLRENPDWPSLPMVRRRAEEQLLTDRKPAATVRAFFAAQRPTSAAGKLALAQAFRADGLDDDAADLIRDAWRSDTFGPELEKRIRAAFPEVLTRADHAVRMNRFLFKESWSHALRAAEAAGPGHVALAKARRAVEEQARNAAALLDAVPGEVRSDPAYAFARAQHLRRQEKAAEAAKAIAGVSRDPAVLVDGDAWWTERRLIARLLLDGGDAKGAYEVAAGHGASSNAKRIEAEFHAGWIALRFLDDARRAAPHFEAADRIAATPISVARAAYWRGRAAEAAGDAAEADRHYVRAAEHGTTFYGQLALDKTGRDRLVLRAADPLQGDRDRLEALPAVRAIRLLHQIDEGDLAAVLFADLAQRLGDGAQLQALGDVAAELKDPRALLVVGKTALQRGFPLEAHAYPTIGIPSYDPIGEQRVDKAMVYAIARQESAFNAEAVSSAGARGLMQLMPATAQRTAKRFGVGYDIRRLTADPSYNTKLGSAHLRELMDEWRGSHILTFASYNAGGPNVKKWIAAYGDPRNPSVDWIDWVERIPFYETRNYVQRVAENLQVYRVRLDGPSALLLGSGARRSASIP